MLRTFMWWRSETALRSCDGISCAGHNFSAFFLYTLISFAGGLLAIGLGYLAAR